jgi:hypothetical protein
MNPFDRIDVRIKLFFQTDAEFEREIGAPAKITDQWRNRGKKSYLKRIPQIAKALQTTSAYLLFETDDPEPKEKQAAPNAERPETRREKIMSEAKTELSELPVEDLERILGMIRAYKKK